MVLERSRTPRLMASRFDSWSGRKMKIKTTIIISVAFVLIAVAIIYLKMENENTKILIETTEGNFVIELYSDMPITSRNFEKLVREGFYDRTIFHRVIEGFMIQGGDPTGTGTGGPGYKIKDEFVSGHSNLRGTISMANSGPNTGGSQFFINLIDNTYLDYNKAPLTSKHPIFGEVVEGMDVIDKIGKVETGYGDKPVKEIKILKATII